MFTFTKEEIKEATQRADSAWLSMKPGKAETTLIINWDSVQTLTELEDFDKYDDIVVIEIPLYFDADEAIHKATKYIFNLIEIYEKQKENKELHESMYKVTV